MGGMRSFRSIVELWPSRDSMAAEVGAYPNLVSKWWQRNSIPVEWWQTVLSTRTAREAGLTAALFVKMSAREVA
jgi:hypothetical protein